MALQQERHQPGVPQAQLCSVNQQLLHRCGVDIRTQQREVDRLPTLCPISRQNQGGLTISIGKQLKTGWRGAHTAIIIIVGGTVSLVFPPD